MANKLAIAGMLVSLRPPEVEFCDVVAHKRQASADKHGRVTGNSASREHRIALYRNVVGARAEGAAYKWFKHITGLKIEWNYRVISDLRNKTADLEGFIDVKGVANPGTQLMLLPRGTNPDWAYLLVDGTMHPTYKVFGWAWGRDGLKLPKQDKGTGRPAHFIGRELLEYPWALAQEIIARRGIDG